MYGLSDEEISAIREGHFEAFPPPEIALLRMADAMADTRRMSTTSFMENCAGTFPRSN